MRTVPCTDKLIIASNLNARIEKVDKWPRVIGPRRVGKRNSNSELLLDLLGIQFGHHKHYKRKRKEHHKTTQKEPYSKQWHL